MQNNENSNDYSQYQTILTDINNFLPKKEEYVLKLENNEFENIKQENIKEELDSRFEKKRSFYKNILKNIKYIRKPKFSISKINTILMSIKKQENYFYKQFYIDSSYKLIDLSYDVNKKMKNNNKIIEKKKLRNSLKIIKHTINQKKSFKVFCNCKKLTSKMIKKLSELGIHIINEYNKDFDLFVIDSFKKDIDVLIAINRGKQVINFKWLENLVKLRYFVPFDSFIFEDKKIEKNLNFSLFNSIFNSKNNNGILKNYKIWIPRNIKPSYFEIRDLIESAQGHVLNEKYYGNNDFCLNIINKDDLILKSELKNFRIYSVEFLIETSLKQIIELDKYKIK